MAEVQETTTRPLGLEVVELSRYLARGMMDAGMDLCTIFTSPTVDLFGIIGGFGYLGCRILEFATPDWLAACAKLPPRTTIDPAEWELHPMGFESIFIPPPD